MYFSSARFIMVPYYPWKLSHRHHHKNTGNIDKDEIFYPVRENRDEINGHRRRQDSCLTLFCTRTTLRPEPYAKRPAASLRSAVSLRPAATLRPAASLRPAVLRPYIFLRRFFSYKHSHKVRISVARET